VNKLFGGQYEINKWWKLLYSSAGLHVNISHTKEYVVNAVNHFAVQMENMIVIKKIIICLNMNFYENNGLSKLEEMEAPKIVR